LYRLTWKVSSMSEAENDDVFQTIVSAEVDTAESSGSENEEFAKIYREEIYLPSGARDSIDEEEMLGKYEEEYEQIIETFHSEIFSQPELDQED